MTARLASLITVGLLCAGCGPTIETWREEGPVDQLVVRGAPRALAECTASRMDEDWAFVDRPPPAVVRSRGDLAWIFAQDGPKALYLADFQGLPSNQTRVLIYVSRSNITGWRARLRRDAERCAADQP